MFMSERNLSSRWQSRAPSMAWRSLLIALGLFNVALAQTPPLIDIGLYHGAGINNAGQVAISSSTLGGIYANGSVSALPHMPGITSPIMPLAINASGQVAGS